MQYGTLASLSSTRVALSRSQDAPSAVHSFRMLEKRARRSTRDSSEKDFSGATATAAADDEDEACKRYVKMEED